jgi:hypothetical protein
MKIYVENIIQLLHEIPWATLATHSVRMAGYPYLSLLPLVFDEHHRPILFISALAEHTKNLRADPKASLLVFEPEGADVQAGTRLTLIGDAEPFSPSQPLIARFLRYQPEAERYLGFADFSFFLFQPRALRLIEGFGQMGWLDGQSLVDADWLSLDGEARLIELLKKEVGGANILGIDRYGIDFETRGARRRKKFDGPPVDVEHLPEAAIQLIRRFSPA